MGARRVLTATGVWLLGSSAWAQDLGPTPEFDSWALVTMADQPVGRLHTVSTVEPDGGQRLEMTTEMKVLRAGTELSIEMHQITWEDAAGRLERIVLEQAAGTAPVRTELEVQGDEAVVTISGAGSAPITERVTIPEGCAHGAGSADRLVHAAIASGKDEVTSCMIDPQVGLTPVRNTVKRVGREEIEVGSRRVDAVVVSTASSAMPGIPSTSWLDPSGRAVRTVQSVAGIALVIVETEREPTFEADPAEMFNNTLVRPDKSVRRPRHTRRATWLLSTREGDMPELPTEGPQVARAEGRGRVRVTVDTEHPARVGLVDAAPFLARSSMIDGEDPAVLALVDRAAVSGTPQEQAEQLRAFVHDFIDDKNLGSGLAGSHEVAERASGDCTEHAVLLAAMLRSRQIPARVVSGIVYVDLPVGGVFGFHMWTQALLDDGGGGKVWRDLDATLDPELPFDATHIAFAVTALGDAEGQQPMLTILPVIGNLDVRVGAVR